MEVLHPLWTIRERKSVDEWPFTESNWSNNCLTFLYFSDTEQKCEEFTDLSIHNALAGTDLKVKLLLYTRTNQNCSESLSEYNTTASTYLDVTKKTVFIVHGFRLTGSTPIWLNDIKELLLSLEDVNLIIVDWNRGATTIIYPNAVHNSRRVAEILKKYIDQMLVRQTFTLEVNYLK